MTKKLGISAPEAERAANDKYNALRPILEQSGSKVVKVRALALVDLQGIYLNLHAFLSRINFPIESGIVIGKLAALQINEVFREIPRHAQRKYDVQTGALEDLIDSMHVENIGGKPHLAELQVLENGVYFDIQRSFEVFYALPPLEKIEWQLQQEARKGNQAAKSQANEIKNGILRTKLFHRDYKYYGDFVEVVKGSANCHGSSEGFFTHSVQKGGLDHFDEKEVDTRITIRAMEAIYEKQTETLCIISSDQDFVPIKEKCDKFGIEFFQSDMAKFTSEARVGKKITDLSENFIRGILKREWPLQILLEFAKPVGEAANGRNRISENEARALASFHNMMNDDFKINLVTSSDNKAQLQFSRPLKSDVVTRVDAKTKMKQILLKPLEY